MIKRGNKIKLTNSFHGTTISVIPLATGYLSPRQALKVERALCGFVGCTCGKHGIGMRDGDYVADQAHDGSAMLYSR